MTVCGDILINWIEKYELIKLIDIPEESLAPYWNSLTGVAQKRWYANEVWMKNEMGLKTVDEKAFEMLRTAKRSENHTYIKGTPNYEIIQNMQYCD
jgi:hypothetical protein